MIDATVRQQEIAAEQLHVDRVYARLAQLRQEAIRAESEGYRLARVGTFGSLVERDAMVFHAARRRYVLDAEHEGLVFGRLDLRGGQTYHVGRLGVRDEDAKPLVIDWRAPAAAAFYQATPADPQGVVRRRMIQSSRERVTGIEDDLLDPAAAPPGMHIVGDGALLASLSRTTGRAMRDIVGTIQREQDEAIRSPASGITIVSGGPGTGKTAVALHRAAYLLYSDRNRFAAGGVLVVGPSAVFVQYISAVLPSLGEDTATLRSLADLVPGVTATRVDDEIAGAAKGSLRMRKVLERAVRDAVPGAPTELRLLYRGGLLRLGREQLARIWTRALPRGARRNEVRRAGIDGLFEALWAQAREVIGAGVRPSQAQFEDELSEHAGFRDFLRAWWPMLRPRRVLGWLGDAALLGGWADGVLSRAEVAAVAASYARLAEDGPTVADVALLDELDELLGQPPQPARRKRNPFQVAEGVREVSTYADRQRAARAAVERSEDYREYAHIVVDESQDVTPMQWRMIGRRGRYASWTIVGDPAQSAWAGDPQELTRARDAALGSRPRNEYGLTTNYRNSAEIFGLAADVIREAYPDLELPIAVRSTGVAPAQLVVRPDELPGALLKATEQMLSEVDGTIGVISPVGRRDEVASWLGDAADRVQIVTALQAKGMEYDGVLLVEPEEIRKGAASGVRTLYVALSRATQRLTTLSTD